MGPNEQYAGYTKLSGRCLVTAAERDGVRLIAVTMNAPDDWNDHKKMLDYGFGVCKKEEIVKTGDIISRIAVGGEHIGLCADSGAAAVALNGRTKGCEIVLHRPKELSPPINRGEKLGYADVIQNGYKIAEFNLIAERDVYCEEQEQKQSLMSKMKDLFHNITNNVALGR